LRIPDFHVFRLEKRSLLRQNQRSVLEQIMKAQVYVTLKPSVLDPQGKAIHHSVELLGFGKIADVRQGKFFEIELSDTTTADEARASVERIAKDVLANPVIEDYRVEILA
jgi:phosphoribosylformylglycinamidine synthase